MQEGSETEVSVLPLAEPLRQPTILSDSGAYIWKLIADAGPSGVTLEQIMCAVEEVLPSDPTGEESTVELGVEDFLATLMSLDLLAHVRD